VEGSVPLPLGITIPLGQSVVRRALGAARATLSVREWVLALERTAVLAELGLDGDVLAAGLLHG
jgi:hypothetical protein